MNKGVTTKNTEGTKNKAYPKYKPSGVEWLGDVPEHWICKPIKYIAKVNGRIGFRGYTIDDLVDEGEGALVLGGANLSKTGRIDLSKKTYLSWVKYHESPEIKVEAGDILFGQRGTCGFPIIVDYDIEPTTINPSLVIIKQIKQYSRFLCYWLMSDFITSTINNLISSTAVPMLSQEQIGNFFVPLPPLPEQQAIAAFLDRETGRIDALIEKKQRLLELLVEQRTALISATVTGKIDITTEDTEGTEKGNKKFREFRAFRGYPKYKPSGVEWLGDVPEHWGVKRAGLAFSIQLGKMLQPDTSTSEDEQFEYLKALHVQWETIQTNDLPVMWASKYELGKYSVKKGDLLVCEGGEVGRAGILKDDLNNVIIQNSLHRVRSKINLNTFLMYVLENAASKNWFEILCNKATIAHFTGDKFSALRIPLPPLPEQQAIAAFLDCETAKIDALSAKVVTVIERLKEYRTALISSAVTGKINVSTCAESAQVQGACYDK